MEEKKITISLSTAILMVLLIAALVVGLVFYLEKDNDSNTVKEPSVSENVQQPISNSLVSNETVNNNLTTEDTNSINNDNTAVTNDINNSDTIPTEDENKKPVENTTPQVNTNTGKSSSKENPLNVGEWGIASKYMSGGYIDVPARVTKVTRGSSAAQEVKNYCNSGSSIYKYEDAKQGMEWAIIDYDVDLTKIEKSTTVRLDTKITGTGTNTSIKYKDVTYIVTTMNMTSEYTKGKVVNCKFAVQLPIGCTDYLIALGTSSSTQAFINGK